MRLEFEPNASALPFVENEVVNQNSSSEVNKMLREGVKAAQEGNRAEARNLLLQVTDADADNENAWLWLASISEYPEELLVFLNNVLRVNPQNERALEWHKATKSLLAKTLVQRGVDAVNDNRQDFARQCFEQAIEHESDNEMAWLWLASVADSEEEKAGYFEKVLSINPENETAQASLDSIKSQKIQKLFQDALVAAFDGNHAAAQEMLETLLSQDSEMEDAWVLKSHLANSFEERAECFLKLRALNPENEMAKANLASWRALADKRAELPKTDENQEVKFEEVQEVAAVESEEVVVAESEEVAAESFSEEVSNEEASAEFTDYPSMEAVSESAAQAEEVSAESEAENQVSEFSEQETVYFEQPENEAQESFAAESVYSEDYVNPDSPTQELSFVSDAQTEGESVDFSEAKAEESEASFEEFQNTEVQFESEESQESVQEFSEEQDDLAAETQAEEEEMHWAFSEAHPNKEAEDFFRDLAESDEIHKTQSQDIHETQFAQQETESFSQEPVAEAQAESSENAVEAVAETAVEEQEADWRNTSPSVFVNYAPETPENSFVAEAEKVSEPETAVAEEVAEAPEMFAENNYQHQFEEQQEVVEAVEEKAEEMVEEPVSMEAESAVQEQPKEEFQYPKAEMLLCPFCNAENEKQAFSCVSCQTVLTLSDLEMLLNQQDADVERLHQAVESLESENESYGLNAEQLANLGIGHINLKNHRQGFFYLQEAVRMNPSNVILDAQVNALAIRLSEIEEQQTAHDAMAKNRKILVVDDSPTVRKLISGKLEKCGHEVICAVDGLDALQKINDLIPDLILLDITMPRMDGYQVCKLIRSNETTKEVPVVMISGKDGFFDKVRGKMAGTTGYITKPFGPETLMKTVETYLN